MNDDDKTCKDMVREMLNTEDAVFTQWECDFLDNVAGKTTFTDKQKDCIEKIYKKRMP